MGDFGSAIKSLYQDFILRDVLSFVMPGAIVVLTAFLLFLPETCFNQRLDTLFSYSQDMHWLLYIPIFGLFYMVGFAIQCLGEMFGFVRFSPLDEKSWGKRWSMFTFGWDKNCKEPCKSNTGESNIWWRESERFWAKFFKAVKEPTKDNEGKRQGRERLVIMKQMCANGFLATIIAALLVAINLSPSLYVKLVLVIILVVLPLIASLFWGHRVHMLQQYTREKTFTCKEEEASTTESQNGT